MLRRLLLITVSVLSLLTPARGDGPESPTTPVRTSIESTRLGVPARTDTPGNDLERSFMPTRSLSRTLIALAFVVGLILVLAAVTRRFGRGRGGLAGPLNAAGAPSGVIEILGRYPAGAGRALVLLKIDRRVLLLSQSSGGKFGVGGGYDTITEFTDPDEVASLIAKTKDAEGDSISQRFGALLGQHGERHDEAERVVAQRVPTPFAEPRTRSPRDHEETREGEDPRSAIASLRRRLSQIGGERA